MYPLKMKPLYKEILWGGNTLNKLYGRTVHAIGAGLAIAEIQQNSDTTYRVYDWGRLSADGTPRELHIEKTVAASDTKKFDGSQPELSVFDGQNKPFYYPADISVLSRLRWTEFLKITQAVAAFISSFGSAARAS